MSPASTIVFEADAISGNALCLTACCGALQAWQALGYAPPGSLDRNSANGAPVFQVQTGHGTSIQVVQNRSRAAPAEIFCKPASLCRPPRHPWARRVQRVCKMLTMLEKVYHEVRR